MSTYERFARDWVERVCREREERDDADLLHDDRKDRALSDSAFDDAEELWGVK